MPVKKRFVSARQIRIGGFLLVLWLASACGTFDVSVEESVAVQGTSPVTATVTGEPNRAPTETPGASEPAVAWYGSIHSLPGGQAGDDYFKPWHLAIWPKFGRAVGLTGLVPAVSAEIDRLRDQDIKATFWGELVCGVADYGACQLRVERISANDGGPQYEPDRVEDWTGRIGRLPDQPGSQNEILYFVLDGPVIALYGIASEDPAIQAELERLAGQSLEPEDRVDIRIWGELISKAQPVTGTRINVERLEILPP